MNGPRDEVEALLVRRRQTLSAYRGTTERSSSGGYARGVGGLLIGAAVGALAVGGSAVPGLVRADNAAQAKRTAGAAAAADRLVTPQGQRAPAVPQSAPAAAPGLDLTADNTGVSPDAAAGSASSSSAGTAAPSGPGSSALGSAPAASSDAAAPDAAAAGAAAPDGATPAATTPDVTAPDVTATTAPTAVTSTAPTSDPAAAVTGAVQGVVDGYADRAGLPTPDASTSASAAPSAAAGESSAAPSGSSGATSAAAPAVAAALPAADVACQWLDGASGGPVIHGRSAPASASALPALVQPAGSSATYLVVGGTAYRIPDDKTLAALGYHRSEVTSVSSAILDNVSRGPVLSFFRSGHVVRDRTTHAYYLSDGQVLHRLVGETTIRLAQAVDGTSKTVEHRSVTKSQQGQALRVQAPASPPAVYDASRGPAWACAEPGTTGIRLVGRLTGVRTADGTGALPVQTGSDANPTYYLVTGNGTPRRLDAAQLAKAGVSQASAWVATPAAVDALTKLH